MKVYFSLVFTYTFLLNKLNTDCTIDKLINGFPKILGNYKSLYGDNLNNNNLYLVNIAQYLH